MRREKAPTRSRKAYSKGVLPHFNRSGGKGFKLWVRWTRPWSVLSDAPAPLYCTVHIVPGEVRDLRVAGCGSIVTRSRAYQRSCRSFFST